MDEKADFQFAEYIEIKGHKIPFYLQKSSKYVVRLSFKDNFLVVETQDGTLSSKATAYIEEKSNWIVRNYTKTLNYNSQLSKAKSERTENVLFFGKEIPIFFYESVRSFYKIDTEKLEIYCKDLKKYNKSKLVEHALNSFSKKYLNDRCQQIADYYKFSINSIKVKTHRSKWGSCSSQRNINLNWRLIHLKQEVSDYVIYHELCHLKEMNHSAAFWKLVEYYCPDYQDAEKELKNFVWILKIYE